MRRQGVKGKLFLKQKWTFNPEAYYLIWLCQNSKRYREKLSKGHITYLEELKGKNTVQKQKSNLWEVSVLIPVGKNDFRKALSTVVKNIGAGVKTAWILISALSVTQLSTLGQVSEQLYFLYIIYKIIHIIIPPTSPGCCEDWINTYVIAAADHDNGRCTGAGDLSSVYTFVENLYLITTLS